MTNKEIALLILDGLIEGIKSNSEFPVQLSELNTLKILLTNEDEQNDTILIFDRTKTNGMVNDLS